MTTTIKKAKVNSDKKELQRKLSEFTSGVQVKKNVVIVTETRKKLKGVSSYKGYKETQKALADRERKFVKKAKDMKGIAYDVFFATLQKQGKLKAGITIDTRLVSYESGKIIGGVSDTGAYTLKNKYGFEMKKQSNGLNGKGVKALSLLKKESDRVKFLQKTALENKVSDELTTTSKRGIVTFVKA